MCIFHKWGKWKVYSINAMSICRTTGKEFRYEQMLQKRVCLKCGKTQIEKLDEV